MHEKEIFRFISLKPVGNIFLSYLSYYNNMLEHNITCNITMYNKLNESTLIITSQEKKYY